MTVVLDCNILVMCLSSHSPYHSIYTGLVSGKFNLAITVDILLEYEEIIGRKYSAATAVVFTALLKKLPNVVFTKVGYRWDLIKADADDNKYCDCAVAAKANFIVSEDKHFAVLKSIKFPPVSVLAIDDFVEVLNNSNKAMP